jgi:HD-GYP domain-containing protein (c-di-GMP phosphodiesterase class II)
MATQPLESQPMETQEVHHIALRPPEPAQLAMQRAPEIVLQEAAKAAQALRDVIERKPSKVVINGKTFLQFEDWQTLGRFYGVTVAARTTNYIEQGRVRGYECHAEAIRADGQVISAAQAMCLDDEKTWHDKPLFQLRSMAQTRAQAKALRNVLAWVVVMAGYSPTPSEEMTENRNSIASRMEYTPMHPERVRKLCFEIANASNMGELKSRYIFAGNEAKKANDRAALDAFISAKDARKKELL